MSDKVWRAVAAVILIIIFAILNAGCAAYPVSIASVTIHTLQGAQIPEVTNNEFKFPNE